MWTGSLTAPHSRALVRRVVSSGGFSVTHHRIEFYGCCAACRGRSGRPRAARRRNAESPPASPRTPNVA